MSKRLLLLAVLLAGFAPGLLAAPAWSWSTTVDAIISTGDTRYLMEEFGNPGVSSELIFPLNTLLAGVTFRGDRTGGRRDWGFEASVAVNLLAPFGLMQDWDWDMYPGYPKVPYSYTESSARMVWLTACASWKPVLASGGWGSLEAALGYRLQYMYQEENGINGWKYADDELDADTDPDLWIVSYPGVLALTYWVLWNVPTAGLSVTLRPVAGVAVKAEAGVAVPYVADEDDHVLRYKLSTASGLGFGGYVDLVVRYSWGKAQARVRPFLSLAIDAMALKANTPQTQSWYGNDPGFSGDETGMQIPGVDHQISTRQFAVVLAGGVEY